MQSKNSLGGCHNGGDVVDGDGAHLFVQRPPCVVRGGPRLERTGWTGSAWESRTGLVPLGTVVHSTVFQSQNHLLQRGVPTGNRPVVATGEVGEGCMK